MTRRFVNNHKTLDLWREHSLTIHNKKATVYLESCKKFKENITLIIKNNASVSDFM